MLSAWKRFVTKNDSDLNGLINGSNNHSNLNGTPPGIQKLDKELQRKFAHGVHYNLKVIIKGDARVGKTALFKRLEGHEFEDNYPPTENLTVTSINWNYKASDNIVKIDLWEAIDPIWRKNNNSSPDLKLENQIQTQNGNSNSNGDSNNSLPVQIKPQQPQYISSARLAFNDSKNPIPEEAKESLARLSENLDVYKGSNAVLLVFDMTKLWTFKYVQAELPKVPSHIPVLVVANHRDMGHHRTVSTEQAKSFIDSLERNPGDALIMYTEASMKNSFGLKMIDKFFNVAFLKLQEASLLKQLELNRSDYMTTLEELEVMGESVDRDYENYLELKTLIRRQQADAMSPVNSGLTKLDESTREKIRNATVSSSELGVDMSQVKSIESAASKDDKGRAAAVQSFAESKFVNDRLPSIVIGAKCALPDTKKVVMNNRTNGNNSNGPKTTTTTTTNVDNTAYDNDKNHTKQQEQQKNNINNNNDQDCSDDSDEDEEPRANPLVANYQSDLDSDDQLGKGE